MRNRIPFEPIIIIILPIHNFKYNYFYKVKLMILQSLKFEPYVMAEKWNIILVRPMRQIHHYYRHSHAPQNFRPPILVSLIVTKNKITQLNRSSLSAQLTYSYTEPRVETFFHKNQPVISSSGWSGTHKIHFCAILYGLNTKTKKIYTNMYILLVYISVPEEATSVLPKNLSESLKGCLVTDLLYIIRNLLSSIMANVRRLRPGLNAD